MLDLNKYYVIVDTDGTKFDLGDVVFIQKECIVSEIRMWKARKFGSIFKQIVEENNVLKLSDEAQTVMCALEAL